MMEINEQPRLREKKLLFDVFCTEIFYLPKSVSQVFGRLSYTGLKWQQKTYCNSGCYIGFALLFYVQ